MRAGGNPTVASIDNKAQKVSRLALKIIRPTSVKQFRFRALGRATLTDRY